MNRLFPLLLTAALLLPAAFAQPLPTTAYQGYLEQNGTPVNDPNATLTFRLFRTNTGGSALWTETKTGVAVTDGVFNVALGSQTPLVNTLFDGALFLSTAVGGPSAAQLSPRTVLRAAPYARTLLAPARITGAAPSNGAVLRVENTANADNQALWGVSSATSGFTRGAVGETASTGGTGVYGLATATTGSTTGVWGYAASTSGTGVFGSGGAKGVHGYVNTTNSVGVWGEVQNGTDNGWGVYGVNPSAPSDGGGGVYGSGLFGVLGETTGPSGIGVYGHAGPGLAGTAGFFQGNVEVTGVLSKGGGSFQIDHPLDPEGRILRHSFVESPDMMNVYNGNVTLDARGEATVALPAYFEALNRDFRYGLTCIGGHAPVFVAEEVRGNRFKIAGGTPGLRVSWQVTGVRQDAWANENRIVVEQDKPAEQRGRYLHPSAFGQPEARGVAPDPVRGAGRGQEQRARAEQERARLEAELARLEEARTREEAAPSHER